jgi:hypothetical protein
VSPHQKLSRTLHIGAWAEGGTIKEKVVWPHNEECGVSETRLEDSLYLSI